VPVKQLEKKNENKDCPSFSGWGKGDTSGTVVQFRL
jgi:hypothetical protein